MRPWVGAAQVEASQGRWLCGWACWGLYPTTGPIPLWVSSHRRTMGPIPPRVPPWDPSQHPPKGQVSPSPKTLRNLQHHPSFSFREKKHG